MHTPDGFITSWICVLLLFASVAAIYSSWKNRGRWLNKLAKMGFAAAVIFLLQMLNFPVANGTSGHFLGAAFAFLFLGVDAAVIVMAFVLFLQALVFGDGGMIALGANVFNMSVLGVYSASFAYEKVKKKSENIARLVACWTSVVIPSLFTAVELAFSGMSSLLIVATSMASVHAVIGLGEAIITGALIALVAGHENKFFSTAKNAGIALTAFAAFTLLALPFASSNADGLEKTAINLGFYSRATTVYSAPLTDYSPAIASVVLGAGICFAFFALASRFKIVSKEAGEE